MGDDAGAGAVGEGGKAFVEGASKALAIKRERVMGWMKELRPKDWSPKDAERQGLVVVAYFSLYFFRGEAEWKTARAEKGRGERGSQPSLLYSGVHKSDRCQTQFFVFAWVDVTYSSPPPPPTSHPCACIPFLAPLALTRCWFTRQLLISRLHVSIFISIIKSPPVLQSKRKRSRS